MLYLHNILKIRKIKEIFKKYIKYCNKLPQNPKVFGKNADKNNKETREMMNVNAQYKLGIDTTTLKQVSQEILKRAAEKNSQYNADTSRVNTVFRPADIGIDLYKGNVDTKIARQVALNNSGLQIKLNQEVLNSIQYLNSKAAQNVQKNVEGKITVALNEGVGNSVKTEKAPENNGIMSLAAGKDKNGSAPSYKGEFLFIKRQKEQDEKVA